MCFVLLSPLIRIQFSSVKDFNCHFNGKLSFSGTAAIDVPCLILPEHRRMILNVMDAYSPELTVDLLPGALLNIRQRDSAAWRVDTPVAPSAPKDLNYLSQSPILPL